MAVSKSCTQDLPVVTARKARVLDFCLRTIRPFQKFFFKEYFFSGKVAFGVPFSTNFLSSPGFLGFRKALEQDAMSSSVSGVRRLENFLTRVRYLISLQKEIHLALYLDKTLPLVY